MIVKHKKEDLSTGNFRETILTKEFLTDIVYIIVDKKGKGRHTEVNNLIFSLNATMPVFILMLLGILFRKMGLMEGRFVDQMNQFVFKIALPFLLFKDLSQSDFSQVWDAGFVLYCFAATLAGIFLAGGVSLMLKDKKLRGEFIQASYRSSSAILGIAFIKNIYGNAGMAPLMIIGSVPLYNIMAVLILSFTRPDREKLSGRALAEMVKSVFTNPIILGILAGMAWSLLGLKQPDIMERTVSSLSATATPLGLMAMGAAFNWKKAEGAVRPSLAASAMKLVVMTALFLPTAIWLGFRKEELVAILAMLGSSATVSCFVMARNMGHEGILTSSVVGLTTLGSAFTLTLWLYILRSAGLI